MDLAAFYNVKETWNFQPSDRSRSFFLLNTNLLSSPWNISLKAMPTSSSKEKENKGGNGQRAFSSYIISEKQVINAFNRSEIAVGLFNSKLICYHFLLVFTKNLCLALTQDTFWARTLTSSHWIFFGYSKISQDMRLKIKYSHPNKLLFEIHIWILNN